MRNSALWLGPVLATVVALWLGTSGQNPDIPIVGFVAVLCVVWWVFEPIPIPVTSLLPLAVLPLMGVLSSAEVGAAYGSPLILLLLGGFILSQAMEHSGAHRRIAIGMVHVFGAHSGPRLVMGFMAASAVLSMWISNTATTLMLLPVVLAVLDATPDKNRLAAPLLLGVAYAASVGGIGTPIGTPPNLIFMQVYEEVTGETPEVGAVHAGLECGIIGEKYPGMDMISFGPQIEFPHSPDERVRIPSVGPFWDVLVATLERLAA